MVQTQAIRSGSCTSRRHNFCSGMRGKISDPDRGPCGCVCHDKKQSLREQISIIPAPASTTRARHADMGATTDLAHELQMAKIASLHLRGISQPTIATELGVGLATVETAITVMRTRWANAAIVDIDEAIREELAKINQLEAEFWDAWDHSKIDLVLTEEQARLLRMKGVRVTLAGDVSFLNGVLSCIDRRIKLKGLDAPIKIDIGQRVRDLARAAGLDEDEAVRKAEEVIKEARARSAAISG